MFPLSHMMKTFIQTGRLDVIDADGRRHVFEGKPGPRVVMRLSDKRLYRDLVFKSEIAAAEAYMDGTMTFEEGSTVRDFLRQHIQSDFFRIYETVTYEPAAHFAVANLSSFLPFRNFTLYLLLLQRATTTTMRTPIETTIFLQTM